MSWTPTEKIWDEAERKAQAQRLRAEAIQLAEHQRKHGSPQSNAETPACADTSAAPPTISQAIESLRPLLADSVPTKARIKALWAAAKKARGIGPTDQVHAAFMALAIETNLIDARGYWTGSDVQDYVRRHGREDVAHVITWALRGWNPFEKGPLK